MFGLCLIPALAFRIWGHVGRSPGLRKHPTPNPAPPPTLYRCADSPGRQNPESQICLTLEEISGERDLILKLYLCHFFLARPDLFTNVLLIKRCFAYQSPTLLGFQPLATVVLSLPPLLSLSTRLL